jgi:Peptidase family M48
MKKILFFFVCCSFIQSSIAQTQKVNQCGYIIPKRPLFRNNFQSVYEARDIVKSMLDTIKWKENFSIREQNGSNNAFATVISGKRWIIYDNVFLESIDEYAATKWASISVLAHEVGHHKYNHVLSGKGSTVPTEIEADDFSGYVMARLGATLPQSVAAIQTIATEKASATHPAKKDRVTAITKGWNRAAAEMKAGGATTGGGTTGTGGTGNTGTGNTGSGNTGNGNTGTGGNNTQTDPATDPTWISLSMQNTQTESVLLSDDGKNFQAAEMKPGTPFVFKFEVYQWGWLKLKYYNGYRVFKLLHGKDYAILYNRRTKNWTVVEVPD